MPPLTAGAMPVKNMLAKDSPYYDAGTTIEGYKPQLLLIND